MDAKEELLLTCRQINAPSPLLWMLAAMNAGRKVRGSALVTVTGDESHRVLTNNCAKLNTGHRPTRLHFVMHHPQCTQ
jgi:hypothetical protein